MDYLSALSTATYNVTYPIIYILNLILFVLAIITAPLLHLGHYCLYACCYAFRVIGKFEASQTLYIFFGVAALVGVVTGTSLHYISGFIISTLHLASVPEEQKARSLASYRAEKQEKRNSKDLIMKLRHKDLGLQRNDLRLREDQMEWSPSRQDRGRGGSRFNTILEEDSSDGL